MKFSELIAEVAGAQTTNLASDPEIRGICEDSRKVKPGDLFVARGGTKVSGAQFAADAIAKGAVAVVSEEPIAAPAGVAFARVANANLALALLAHAAAGWPTRGMKVIGITGTKGKTTVAYLLRSVLKAAGHTVGMIGTVEIDDGKTATPAEMTTPGAVELVNLFCRMRDHGVTHCVMEVSSHSLHQHRVAGIDFAVGCFTNLTGDHLDYHKTMEDYAAAKAILFAGLKPGAAAVINADDAWAKRMAEGCPGRVVRYRLADTHSCGECVVRIWEMNSAGMRFQAIPPNGMDFEVQTPLVGRHNAYNLACVIAAADAVGVDRDRIHAGIANNTGAPGRLQPVIVNGQARNQMPFQVFVDYAHTHDALQNVLTAVRGTMGPGRLICLFGCGGDRDRTKRPKMAAIAERLADRVIVTSDNPRTEEPARIIDEICTGFSPKWQTAGKITVEPDRRAAIQAAIGLARPGDVVLLAGKGHENYQILGTTKHHFDDVEEAQAAMASRLAHAQA